MANLLVYFFASFLTQNGPQLLTTGFKGDGFRSEKYQFCHQQAHKMWNTLFAGDLKLSHFVILLSMRLQRDPRSQNNGPNHLV